ncbi:ABC transporter ATP-binding protein [Allobranchiibius sp. GilTou73]|uniref:ABC transporter ATP-binding protein n=1 Tax=Allobranchiibius sp. GilTou73 TaxID=2904523 RepID=UPI001F278D89|nr:ABC transporter ATP-binding protein [Allobranchiibius sp. GilTou73]UIJ35788.1 ABC transporter ATP-binding protein [Allobranchiibius sp. GilTou73]
MGELQIQDVGVSFDGSPAVDGVDLTVSAGHTLAVLGPSGCGKSTLLRVVAGLQRPDRGRVIFDGVDLTQTPTHRRGFALMFQDGQLFAHLDVAHNVAYALRRRRLPRAVVRARVAELLDLVGLAGLQDRRPGSLSGGQQQRVALARALAAEPRLLLLDEPLSALDTALREQLSIQLRDVLRTTGTTAIMVTHDQGEAFAIADDVALLRDGRVVQHGPALEVWRAPVDADAARFLGYRTVLPADAGLSLGHPGSPIALRRNALRLDRDGPIEATVLSSAADPDGVRLMVRIEGLGDLPAVTDGPAPERGAQVRLRVQPSSVAKLPDVGRSVTSRTD